LITNDYFDLEADRVNHPERPLPWGRISTAEVVVLTTLFTLASAAAPGLPAFLIAMVIWINGSRRLARAKCHRDPLLVLTSTAATPIDDRTSNVPGPGVDGVAVPGPGGTGEYG
jgi:geranylgeranylglycerol-phosphate geranylgeranyltransferase